MQGAEQMVDWLFKHGTNPVLHELANATSQSRLEVQAHHGMPSQPACSPALAAALATALANVSLEAAKVVPYLKYICCVPAQVLLTHYV